MKYYGPRLRIIRRFFSFRSRKLETFTGKISKNNSRPGQHGTKPMKKSSQYSVRLREKQKVRTFYSISEKQIVQYMKKARKIKESTSRAFFKLLEIRLDVIVYRTEWAPTILKARQIVNHGHISVNGVQVTASNRICSNNSTLRIKSLIYQRIQLYNILPVKNIVHACTTPFLIRANSYFNLLFVVEYYSNRL
uniref:Ribosomal protein S4 n=1 Tax=Lepidodinium chlorophorum TaxID=107758 RepID=A0A0F7R4M2_LEPCH|nr:ribosomal protein S4 [Lepidodinium chlorophorum]BAR72353.1 ribosomal protein S4 [Lepidodinium chlorophorum]